MTVKEDVASGDGTASSRLARLALARPKTVLVVAAVALCAGAPLGLTAYNALDPYEFEDGATESAEAAHRVEEASGLQADLPLIILLDASPTSADGRARIEEVTDELAAVDGVESVASPLEGPAYSRVPLISESGDRVYLLPRVETGADDSELIEAVEGSLGEAEDVAFGGSVFADEQVSTQGEEDLQRAELFAFPLLFILSLLFFRGLVAASLPLLLGGINFVGALVALRVLHEAVGIGVLSINVAVALGFGLAIDYSLFIVSRFREELASGHETPEAITRTLATAGRTVMFSSLTVAAAFAALLVFPQNFLYSMGVSGIAVALLAAVGGLVVLPALLVVLGDRVNALAPARLQRSRRTIDLPDRDGPLVPPRPLGDAAPGPDRGRLDGGAAGDSPSPDDRQVGRRRREHPADRAQLEARRDADHRQPVPAWRDGHDPVQLGDAEDAAVGPYLAGSALCPASSP